MLDTYQISITTWSREDAVNASTLNGSDGPTVIRTDRVGECFTHLVGLKKISWSAFVADRLRCVATPPKQSGEKPVNLE